MRVIEVPEVEPVARQVQGAFGPKSVLEFPSYRPPRWLTEKAGPGRGGDHVSLLLVCGQGQWEDTTGALQSTKQFAALLAAKGIKHQADLWGYDVPHDWPS